MVRAMYMHAPVLNVSVLALALASCTPTATAIESPSAETNLRPVQTTNFAPCIDECVRTRASCASFDEAACDAACKTTAGTDLQRITDCLKNVESSCIAARTCVRKPADPPLSKGPYGTERYSIAAPFVLQTQEGDWDFSAEWTGQDSYIFLLYVPALANYAALQRQDVNALLFQKGDIEDLLEASPRNVHYFFGWLRDESDFQATQRRWTSAIQSLSEPDRTHWLSRVHFVSKKVTDTSTWIAQMFQSRYQQNNIPDYVLGSLYSFAIDRSQRIREVGMLSYLDSGASFRQLQHEARGFNFEASTHTRLAQQEARVFVLAKEQLVYSRLDIELTWPTEAELSDYDTLEVDLFLGCEEHKIDECGAWDYGSHLYLCDDASGLKCGEELARWITPYMREGRWVTDISHHLATLKPGKKHYLRWTANGQFDPRKTNYVVTLSLRLTHAQRGMWPIQTTPLWKGGDLNNMYDAAHQPIKVHVPADARKVELVTVLTGHGSEGAYKCSEFCNHEHLFSLNGGTVHRQNFPEAATRANCEQRVNEGVTPNQHGTWYLGRAGWCPGLDVKPWALDVTEEVKKGELNSIAYRTEFQGAAVTESLGHIDLASWLVVWR